MSSRGFARRASRCAAGGAVVPGGRPLLKIALFATLVASYDVVIGYTGIVSFGHAMFFGFGAYAVALSIG